MSDRTPDGEGDVVPGDAPSADLTPGWRELLRAALFEDHPDDILLIGPRAADLLAAERDDASSATVRWHRADSLADCLQSPAEAQRADVALLAPATFERLERVLGTACRLFPNRLLLLVEGPDLPLPERLFAFGFRRVFAVSGPPGDPVGGSADGSAGEAAGDGSAGGSENDPESARGDAPPAALYEYRLRDYKQPPAWLNARFWANPARFDLDEEPSEFDDETEEFEEDEAEGFGGDEEEAASARPARGDGG